MKAGEPRFRGLALHTVTEPFWHQYAARRAGPDGPRTIPVAPTEFNPASGGRFSARRATPARAMYYGSVRPEGALWETLLREVVGHAGVAHIARERVTDARLVRVRPRRPLQLLDLRALPARKIAATPAVLEEIAEARQTRDYSLTHALAVELLAHADAQGIVVDGALWVSKQDGESLVYLLYAPPAGADDLEVLADPQPLDDDAAGWEPIDRALALAGLERITATPDLSEEPGAPEEPR
jgi:hypothetical protein